MGAKLKLFGIVGGLLAAGIIGVFLFFGKACDKSQDSTNRARKSGATTIRIENVVTSPAGKESITIKNTGSNDIDLSGWTLGDRNDPDARGLDDILKAGKTRKYDGDSLGFGINDKDEIIYLRKNGTTIDKWEGR